MTEGTRNRITDEVADRSRTAEARGRYTFNAYPPSDYEGLVVTVAALRLGDHAHLEVSTGRQIVQRDGRPRDHRSVAGHLIFRWEDWLPFRDLLESAPWTRIAEVERPTVGQLDTHLPSSPPRYPHGRQG